MRCDAVVLCNRPSVSNFGFFWIGFWVTLYSQVPTGVILHVKVAEAEYLLLIRKNTCFASTKLPSTSKFASPLPTTNMLPITSGVISGHSSCPASSRPAASRVSSLGQSPSDRATTGRGRWTALPRSHPSSDRSLAIQPLKDKAAGFWPVAMFTISRQIR